jgi:threonine/homoserine/homoserine lactone efflux protein
MDYAALTVFALVACATPGPNNAMLMASGAAFGWRRTWPHLAGVAVGCGLLFLVVGFGLGPVFQAYPRLQQALRYVGAVWLLVIAWRIFESRHSVATATTKGRPMKVIEAALFQWINPKAWQMSLSSIFVLCFPCAGLWVLVGGKMQAWLTNPLRRLYFYGFLSASLVVTVAAEFL